jgi:hypothetical protein
MGHAYVSVGDKPARILCVHIGIRAIGADADKGAKCGPMTSARRSKLN